VGQLQQQSAEPPIIPDALAPIVRFALLGVDGELQGDAVRLVGSARGVGFAAELLSVIRATNYEGFTPTFRILVHADSSKVCAAVSVQMLECSRATDPTRGDLLALGLIGSLRAPDALPLWRQAWSTVGSDAARATLLDTLVSLDKDSLEATELMVELYPQIERLASERRSDVLELFGRALMERALPILEREIRSPVADVRAAAMAAADAFRKHREAVQEFEAWRKAVTVEESTVAELSKLLTSSNRDVVLGAVKALGILRARPALPALVKLLERDDLELRAAVQAALDAMGGS
jgi:hypothetical protein